MGSNVKENIIKSLKIACLFLGCVVGAGFASGKEIVRFFAFYPSLSYFVALAVFIVFFLLAYLMLEVGKIIKPHSLNDITNALFGRGSKFFNVLIILSYLMLYGAMLAAIDSLFINAFNLGNRFKIYSILILIIAFMVLHNGIGGLKTISLILVPIMVSVIFFVYLYSAFNNSSKTFEIEGANAFNIISNICLYAGMNILLSSSILCEAGAESKKTNLIGSLLGTLIFAGLIFIILLGIFAGGTSALKADMPILFLSRNISKTFIAVSAVIILFGIFTSLLSSLYPLIKYANTFISKKIYIYILLGILGLLLKNFGFAQSVNYSFPIIGCIGLVFIIYAIIFYFKNRRAI